MAVHRHNPPSHGQAAAPEALSNKSGGNSPAHRLELAAADQRDPDEPQAGVEPEVAVEPGKAPVENQQGLGVRPRQRCCGSHRRASELGGDECRVRARGEPVRYRAAGQEAAVNADDAHPRLRAGSCEDRNQGIEEKAGEGTAAKNLDVNGSAGGKYGQQAGKPARARRRRGDLDGRARECPPTIDDVELAHGGTQVVEVEAEAHCQGLVHGPKLPTADRHGNVPC